MKIHFAAMVFTTAAASAAVFSTNNPDKDAFVRAFAPNSNYGGAGALSISGTNPTTGNPTNGPFDSFMSFNAEPIAATFNGAFGVSNWVVTSTTLNLTENSNPGNGIFNYGTGSFLVRWTANDTWLEGTGNPMNPTMDGVTYGQEPAYLNTNTDVNLGFFNFTGAAKTSFSLGLADSFVANIASGGEVGLFFTAVSPQIGYLFYSHNYAGNPAALPTLVVSAMAQPAITSVAFSGTNLVLSATNGVAGATYFVLTSTNLAVPANLWAPIATNTLRVGGSFSTTLTNAAGFNGGSPCYYILQTR